MEVAAAILPLQNMDFALDELQRVVRIPAVRAVYIRPMFVENRYLNHPYYDPLWAELERLGITAAVHATPGLWMCFSTEGGPQYKPAEDAELACKFAFEAGPDRRRLGPHQTVFFMFYTKHLMQNQRGVPVRC